MTTTREEQRDVVDDPTYSLEVVHGKAGDCVCLNDRRICGPKPWGGGRITSTWSVRRSDILAAIPDLEAENDRLRASQAGGVPAGWMDISTAPKDDTLFLAACPPDERFPSGRIMIWCGTILAAQNDRTPGHLRFPAKWWMPLPALPVSGGAHAE